MDSATKQSDYPKEVFFLGAGASALAGVPTFANFREKADDICNKKLLNNESNKQFERVLKYWKKNFDEFNIEEFYEAVEMSETLDNPTDKEKQETVTTDEIENFINSTIQKSIKRDFLFSWDEIPGNHNGKLIDFLLKNVCDWANTATIEKIDDDRTIKVSTEKYYILLKLEGQTYLYIKLVEGTQTKYGNDNFIVKMENGTRNIYKRDVQVHDLYESFLALIEPSVIITTNWDTELETSPKKITIENGGIRYEGVQPYDEIKSQTHRQYRILKLHGSLNWGFCRKCGNIYYFDEKIHDGLASSKGLECKKCSGKLDRIIIPPKLSKLIKPEQNNSEPNDESNPLKSPYFQLRSIWSKASDYLKMCDKLYFIGYSFPETDVQMKTFISNALRENSNLNRLKIIIVSSPKHGNSRVNFEERYLSIFSRFISQSRIEFHYDGFEGYPMYLTKSRNANLGFY